MEAAASGASGRRNESEKRNLKRRTRMPWRSQRDKHIESNERGDERGNRVVIARHLTCCHFQASKVVRYGLENGTIC